MSEEVTKVTTPRQTLKYIRRYNVIFHGTDAELIERAQKFAREELGYTPEDKPVWPDTVIGAIQQAYEEWSTYGRSDLGVSFEPYDEMIFEGNFVPSSFEQSGPTRIAHGHPYTDKEKQ